MELKMLTLCLSGRRCQQDAWCEKIRNAENQTVIPNTCLQPLTPRQAIYATNTATANDLAKARPVSVPGALIKDLLTLPLLLQHIHFPSLRR